MGKQLVKTHREDILAECRDILLNINSNSKMVCDCCLGYGFDKLEVVRIDSGQAMCPGCMDEFSKVVGGIGPIYNSNIGIQNKLKNSNSQN